MVMMEEAHFKKPPRSFEIEGVKTTGFGNPFTLYLKEPKLIELPSASFPVSDNVTEFLPGATLIFFPLYCVPDVVHVADVALEQPEQLMSELTTPAAGPGYFIWPIRIKY